MDHQASWGKLPRAAGCGTGDRHKTRRTSVPNRGALGQAIVKKQLTSRKPDQRHLYLTRSAIADNSLSITRWFSACSQYVVSKVTTVALNEAAALLTLN